LTRQVPLRSPSMMPVTVLLSSGSNAHGQLANETLEDIHTFSRCSFSGFAPGSLPAGTRQILHTTSGANHTLALLECSDDSGELRTELWGCGDGTAGQLGPSYLKDLQSGAPTSIFRRIDLSLEGFQGYTCRLVSASWETTYVVLTCTGKGDVLISMGANYFGDLGIGRLERGKQPVRPFHVVNFGHLVVNGLPLETGNIIVNSLAAGQHHVVVHLKTTLSDGSARYLTVGWGTSRHGQLGIVTTDTGQAVPFLSLPKIIAVDDDENRVVSSALGNQHTILLYTSGRVSGFGSQRKGQLRGIKDFENVRSVDCTWNGTYVVMNDNATPWILATGNHSKGQLGRAISSMSDDSRALFPAPVEFPFTPASHRLLKIACGSEHVLSLFLVEPSSSRHAGDSKTEVWGWGWNEHGNLGIGTTDDVVLPTKLWPSSEESRNHGQRVVDIWAGCGTSWIAINTTR
jgi:protein ATS1